MLVITRKVNESIILAGNIEVTLISIDGGQVRLGFNAPASVRIFRKELVERLQNENREALQTSSELPKIRKPTP